jgi:hypothetical protein
MKSYCSYKRSAEEVFRATCLTRSTAPTIRKLADLSPKTLGLMHGSSFDGDAKAALLGLADYYDELLCGALAEGA